MIKYATIDIETTGLNRYKNEITFIGIGLSEDIGYDFSKEFYYDWSKLEDRKKFHNLVNKLRKRKVKCVWQNGKFDTLFIELKTKLKLPISEDIMLMGTAYDLSAEHGLKPMAQKYLNIPNWDIKKKDKTSNDPEKVIPYLKLDVKYTWELFCFFMDNMTETHMKIYKKLLLPAYRGYRDSERLGIYFDKEEFPKVKAKYKQIEDEKLAQLKAHYNINWNSPQQKADVLFSKDKEGLPIIKKTAKGAPSADAEVCKKLAAKGYEIPKLMLEYTAANTINKMFMNRWDEDSSYDGRIHPNFNLTNVVSGRTSCSEPNLQQVPRTKDVRALYHAPKGYCFFEADYSQLELRIAAHYANEPTMLRIYNEGGDIHSTTAKLMTNGREPTKEERNKAKAVNFGFLYGMGYKKFVDYAYNSYGVIFTLPEAEAFRNAFFAKYTRLLPWHEEQRQLCEMEGGVSNLFGRFRNLPDIYSQDWGRKGSAERRAINTPVQGTGSDILLSAKIEIDKKLSKYGLRTVGSVHDSILGEFPESEKDWIVDEIRRIMIHPHLLDVFGVELKCPLDVDVGVGKWGTH